MEGLCFFYDRFFDCSGSKGCENVSIIFGQFSLVEFKAT